jgi:hypothetical protein
MQKYTMSKAVSNHPKQNIEDELKDIDSSLTVPVSVRIPIKLAFQLQLYSERMNQSTGKIMTSILEDVLPAFSSDKPEVKVRVPQVYRAMEDGSLLQSVNVRDLKERMLKRGEGPIGRLKKSKVSWSVLNRLPGNDQPTALVMLSVDQQQRICQTYQLKMLCSLVAMIADEL